MTSKTTARKAAGGDAATAVLANNSPPLSPSPGSAPRRQPVVRFTNRMVPGRLYPLTVTLAAEGAKAVPLTEAAPSSLPAVTVVPLIPGAQVTPATAVIDGRVGATATFTVLPLTVGKLPGARVEIHEGGRKAGEVPLTVRVSRRRLTKVLLFLTIALPLAVAYVRANPLAIPEHKRHATTVEEQQKAARAAAEAQAARGVGAPGNMMPPGGGGPPPGFEPPPGPPPPPQPQRPGAGRPGGGGPGGGGPGGRGPGGGRPGGGRGQQGQPPAGDAAGQPPRAPAGEKPPETKEMPKPTGGEKAAPKEGDQAPDAKKPADKPGQLPLILITWQEPEGKTPDDVKPAPDAQKAPSPAAGPKPQGQNGGPVGPANPPALPGGPVANPPDAPRFEDHVYTHTGGRALDFWLEKQSKRMGVRSRPAGDGKKEAPPSSEAGPIAMDDTKDLGIAALLWVNEDAFTWVTKERFPWAYEPYLLGDSWNPHKTVVSAYDRLLNFPFVEVFLFVFLGVLTCLTWIFQSPTAKAVRGPAIELGRV